MTSKVSSPRSTLDQIVSAISPASEAQAAGVRQRLAARRSAGEELGGLQRLCERLAAARHSPRPVVDARTLAVFAADHGVADPGVDLGEHGPTITAVRHITSGEAAVCAAARAAGARLILVDCGVRGGDQFDLGRGVVAFRVGEESPDITREPAMTAEQAIISVQTGIALVMSLADDGLDLLALGHVSTGSQPVSGAVVAALTATPPEDLDARDAEVIATALQRGNPDASDPMEVLCKVGGVDLGIMAGAILGAASIDIPVVLDEHATSAAALLATRISPAIVGYLFASHAGSTPCHRRALAALGLEPLFDLGLASGEGSGAALALPMLSAAALVLSGEIPT